MSPTQLVHVNVQVLHPFPLVRQAMSALLGTQSWIYVVAEGAASQAPEAGVPFVVIADEKNAMRLAAEMPTARVIALSYAAREAEVLRVLGAGVHGYVLLGDDLEELLECLKVVARGSRHICRAAASCVAESYGRDELTRREYEVLDLLSEGLCNKRIARALSIAEGTVKTYVKNILGKLDSTTRTHAVTVALQRGLVSRPTLSAALGSGIGRSMAF